MVKRILLAFLLFGFTLGPLAIREASAISDSEIQNMANATQESIKEIALPGWQQYFQTVEDFFIQTKDFVVEKIKAIDVNKMISERRDELNREVEEFKTDLPETFKGLIEWYNSFYNNWLKKT
jgi:DNA-binding transcriptional regulator GbsR (MarR family)